MDQPVGLAQEMAQFQAEADQAAPTSSQLLAAMLRDPSRQMNDGSGSVRYFLHQPIVDQFLADNP